MTRKIAATILLSLAGITSFAQTLHSNAHIGLTYPISTNGVHAASYSNKFSLHAIAGVSHTETAFCVAGVASVIKDSANGFLACGIANIVGNSAKGTQFAGVMNYTKNYTTGFQAAGVVNLTGGIKGVQAAGFANISTQTVTGLQLAGFVNVAKKATTQAAGFINAADSSKSQFAGFINVAHNVNGIQVAGFTNVATEVKGTQIAGFVNVAKKVSGAQIAGFINIADSCDYPIGIVNIIKNGEKSLGVMVDETGTTYATFRSGGRILYGIVAAGFNGSHNRAIYAQQAGLGAHLPITRRFRINGEATFTSLLGKGGSDIQTGIKVLPSLHVWNLELYAGPSFNYALSTIPGAPFNHRSLWSETSYYHTHELYIGMQCGIQYHF